LFPEKINYVERILALGYAVKTSVTKKKVSYNFDTRKEPKKRPDM
jgi:hypothetical protein